MVGRGAARLVSDQARIFDIWRCSSWAKAESKNLACRCQPESLVNGISGESADGIIPARNFAVSSAVAVSAARTADTAANKTAATSVATLTNGIMFIHGPALKSRHHLPAGGKRRKSGVPKTSSKCQGPTAVVAPSTDNTS